MIVGVRVRLRADERADIPRFVEWLNDSLVIEHLSIQLPVSLAGEEQWFEDTLHKPPAERPLAIEIREGQVWRLIGNCGFMNIQSMARVAEVGLFIGERSCWNKGYGTEVMRLLLQHGFATLNLNRIFLRVDATNRGGIRAYEKAGFVHEGRLREAAYHGGHYEDLLIMSVLRSEWTSEKQDQP
jgi:RimJ/RimL family protein N-acetyltransferase